MKAKTVSSSYSSIELYLDLFPSRSFKLLLLLLFQFLFFEYWSFNKFQGISKKNFYPKLKFLIFQEFLRLFQEKLSVQVISRVFQEKHDCLGRLKRFLFEFKSRENKLIDQFSISPDFVQGQVIFYVLSSIQGNYWLP